MSGMPGTQTVRTVRIKSRVTATVTATVKVTDQQVREWLGIDGDEDIDWESVEEFALEETDESLFDLDSIDMWDKSEVELLKTERTHVAPAEFVALPGMEEL
ncbi:hypothetical protein QWJ90_01450 [Microbacterium oryzae]|uniref:hypothetical protein n=1 Tax=Microbacterium oryzae TaxID=743009 RepID=UPI0025AEFA38|nr:hypothetical protein [Microbacterium oryzae]MDN3309588.1 hypothetical protein [Microbacterium oryzae]